MRNIRLLLVLVIVLWAMTAKASFVTPRSLANVGSPSPGEATTGFYGDGETRLYQYAASEMAAQGLMPGDLITGVRARAAGFNGGPSSVPSSDATWSDFAIQLAQAINSIANMSRTPSEDMTNPITVRSGPFRLPANSMPSGVANTTFGYLMSFSTPYVYRGGDLVFYFSNSGATRPSGFPQDAPSSFTGNGTLYRTLLIVNPASGPIGSFGNVMTVLKFETTSVPEPTTARLLAFGMLGWVCNRRRYLRCGARKFP